MSSLADRLILVTGASGFIGSHLVVRLAQDEGAHVRAMARDPSRAPRELQDCRGIKFVPGEMTNADALANAVRDCEMVIHAAALQPFHPLPTREEFQAVNVVGTQNLLRAFKRFGRGGRFLHLGTINEHGLPPPCPCDADTPLNKSGDRYSDSKIDGERAAWQTAREEGIALTVVRPACTFGPRSRAWTLQPLERIRSGKAVFFGSGDGVCNPVYVENLVELIIAALRSDLAVGQAFIGSDGIGVPWREFFGYYARMCNAPLHSIPYPLALTATAVSEVFERVTGRPGKLPRHSVAFYTHHTTFDVSKNVTLLRHTPRVGLEEAMRRTEEWLRAEGTL